MSYVLMCVLVFCIMRYYEKFAKFKSQLKKEFFVRNTVISSLSIKSIIAPMEVSQSLPGGKHVNKFANPVFFGFEPTSSHLRDEFFEGNYLRKSALEARGTVRPLNKHFCIALEYQKNKGPKASHQVELFAFSTQGRTTYLMGYCHLKQKAQVFSISGIKKLTDPTGKVYDNTHAIKDFLLHEVTPYVNNERAKVLVTHCLVQ